ncbi:MAG: glycogen debranching enzyme N-terminal domain-containing protein [Rhizobacter sp.]
MFDDTREWLEADGRGGFASGTVCGVRTRRYHALLLPATTPPTGRIVLVSGIDAWVDVGGASWPLTSQRYAPDVIFPGGAGYLESFTPRPWPAWQYAYPDGSRIRQQLLVEHGTGAVLLAWTLLDAPGPATLRVRPFMSGRDYHALHRRNDAFDFRPATAGARVTFSPYPGLPSIHVESNGRYCHQPDWYLNFLYRVEAERGLDAIERPGSGGSH